MKNINVGIVNIAIANTLKNTIFDTTTINESKEIVSRYFNTIKNSPILQLEFRVYNNILNKHIDNDVVATRYIDNNIKLFETYTIEELKNERKKLLPFVSENFTTLNDDRITIINAISTLIEESLKRSDMVDVDKIHDAFTVVLNHVKSPKKRSIESLNSEIIDENVIKIAVKKFNKKYESLDESDKALLHKLINANDKEKNELLESYKKGLLKILEDINKKENIDNDSIAKAIDKINSMNTNQDRTSIYENIIKLHIFKKEIS